MILRNATLGICILALTGCAFVPEKKELVAANNLKYDYITWVVDAQLDRVCKIPGSDSTGPDDANQRSLRYVRGLAVDTAILHYGVSRVERYSDSPESDMMALLSSAAATSKALSAGWTNRSEPNLLELGKANMVDASVRMAARALEPTSDKVRNYLLNPKDVNAAAELVVGAMEVAMYAKAYANDCNRELARLTSTPTTPDLITTAKLYATQFAELCKSGAARTSLSATAKTELCVDAEGLKTALK